MSTALTKDQLKKALNAVVVFVFFTFEAVVHYWTGKSAGKKRFQLEVPPWRDVVKLLLTVLLFSVASSWTASWLEGQLFSD